VGLGVGGGVNSGVPVLQAAPAISHRTTTNLPAVIQNRFMETPKN
jgi:hypothetical protein